MRSTAGAGAMAQQAIELGVGEGARKRQQIAGALVEIHPVGLHLAHRGEGGEGLRDAGHCSHRRDRPVFCRQAQTGATVALEVDDLVVDRHAHRAARREGAVEPVDHDVVDQRPSLGGVFAVFGGGECHVDLGNVIVAGLHRRLGAAGEKRSGGTSRSRQRETNARSRNGSHWGGSSWLEGTTARRESPHPIAKDRPRTS